ncbi:BgTH12-02144 [Blumeria graminis f. sp. triticale]|uniref:BgtAc-31345 n=3 Tax=Blumeria graminis TaxID=34373 RepID=A0A9X9QCE7_BLUGR|nr:hypothetical protein BGT96224_Ac31345 [Blumeria graminis f. sp. tritici 96224]CAD6501899.1 BgTH12-02144 [Blumeria graminis f. sp. triticale]VDB85825.1 BgtAc-31345 [Blumeria graminis f. sp. tritici]
MSSGKSFQPTRGASQLRDFIDSDHIYTDELDEAVIQRIREASEKEPEESVPSGITKRKWKARRSMIPRFPLEWANSREAFRKAVRQFEYHKNSGSPRRNVTKLNLNIDHLPPQSK